MHINLCPKKLTKVTERGIKSQTVFDFQQRQNFKISVPEQMRKEA